jgi:uncharacterized SAM-binding protein YcdF (DUF218 family)
MDILWTKLLPIAVFPLGASILVFLGALVLLVAGYRRVAVVLAACAVAALWVTSTPAFARWITAGLERQYPPVSIASLAGADAAIILGGVLSPPDQPGEAVDYSGAIDRVFEAARVYRAGKVRHVLVSGGNLPWDTGDVPEALLIAELLGDLGVPAEAIVIEAASRNTYENATNTARILVARGWTKPILVTSGTHMPRAVETFKKAGVDAVPVATDMRAEGPLFETVLDILPDAGALAVTTESPKEVIGLIVYRMRGWA